MEKEKLLIERLYKIPDLNRLNSAGTSSSHNEVLNRCRRK